MTARSSAVAYGHWIGNLVLLAGCGLACFIGLVPPLKAADDVSSRISSMLTMYLSVVACIAILFFFINKNE